jgi:S-DNA-T family DNA segregation ATPase FtsK/SpoIIIE
MTTLFQNKNKLLIEVPNQNQELVTLKSILESTEFNESKNELPLVIGKTITNKPLIVDLTRLGHLLVAGASGQGKTMLLNVIVNSLLSKKSSNELKFVIINMSNGSKNFNLSLEKNLWALFPNEINQIVSDFQTWEKVLISLHLELDARYNLLKRARARNIKNYNEKIKQNRLTLEKGFILMPYIVVIIDEYSNLIMNLGKRFEHLIARLAQLSSNVGIHVIISTNQTTNQIISFPIKANFPNRIAFRVNSNKESVTILDTIGANHLIGNGDMLISYENSIRRVQGAFIDNFKN